MCAFRHQSYDRYWKAPQKCQHSEHTYSTAMNKIKVTDKSDEFYVPDENESKSFLGNISLVKYQVNKIKVDELASSSVRCHKRKFEEVLNSVTENYLKQVAPGQEKGFSDILTGSDDSKNDNHELTLLLDAYNSADRDKQKIMIFSAIDPKTYTKEQVMNLIKFCKIQKFFQSQKLFCKTSAKQIISLTLKCCSYSVSDWQLKIVLLA